MVKFFCDRCRDELNSKLYTMIDFRQIKEGHYVESDDEREAIICDNYRSKFKDWLLMK